MSVAQLVLEYLRVVLSAPPMVAAVTLTFLLVFRGALRGLISRIATIKLPGGSELTAIQDPAPAPEKPPQLPRAAPGDAPALPASLPPENAAEVRELFEAERARAYLWEYRYLNLFLVERTVSVLEWLADVKSRPSLSMYDSLWTPRIPDVEQRKVVVDVLLSHHLVQQVNGLLEITPKGREYLEWRHKV